MSEAARARDPRPARAAGFARGLALALGALGLACAALGVARPAPDHARWRDALAWPAGGLAAASAILAAYGVSGGARAAGRRAAAAAAALGCAIAALDAARTLPEVARTAPPLAAALQPSTLLALAYLAASVGLLRAPRGRFAVGLAAGLAVALVPLAHVAAAARADTPDPPACAAIVVFGARAYADGRPSPALADRVRAGAELWLDGRAPRLVLSGGPGDGRVHEVEAMRAHALALGVPARAIELDPLGVSTAATVASTDARLDASAPLIAVSHGYHLPRIRLAYARRGRAIHAVRARESRPPGALAWLVAREAAAYWLYWTRG